MLISYSPLKDGERGVVGEEDIDGGVERVGRSVTPSLVVCEPAHPSELETHSGRTDTTLNEDWTRPRANSLSLQPPSPQPAQRCRSHSDSEPLAARRKTSLQDVVVAVVPFLPAATLAIKVSVYAAMKALSNQ